MTTQYQQPELSIDVLANQGLRCIRQLRQQAHGVFDFLREGVQPQNDDVLSDEQIFTKDVKQRLVALMETFEQLDKLTGLLPKPPPTYGGNLNYLLQNAISEGPSLTSDISSSQYESVLNTYNWLQRSHEYSQFSTMFVSQYVRRNQSKLFRRQVPVTGFTIHYLTQQLLPAYQKHVPGLQITTLPRGKNTLLIFVTVVAVPQQSPGQMSPPSPIIKIVILTRAQPLSFEWANVKGPDEDFYDDNGDLDLHSPSRYRVFQKLTDHVKGAILHYMGVISSPGQYLQASLKSFFAWLGAYRNLFTDPCANCKRILRDYLPPYCRDYRNVDRAFHGACK